ncbi:MAG: hypothetical protein ACRDHD_00860 [Candidatus Limnocylindria bacterium]
MSDRDLDRVMEAWFDEGPTIAAEAVIDGALARIPTARQRGSGWRWLPFPGQHPRTILRYATLVVAVALLITAVAGLAVVLAPDPQPQPPAPTLPMASATGSARPSAGPTPSGPPSAATGLASISITGATDLQGEWQFFPANRSEAFPELNRYAFYQFRGSACDCPAGAYLHVFLDPGEAYPATVRTGPDLALRLGFPSSGGMRPDEYHNSHPSVMGECEVAFTVFSDTLIEATFTCVDVPSDVNDLLINSSGSFSFDPREADASRPN